MTLTEAISDYIELCEETVSMEEFAHSKVSSEAQEENGDAFHVCDIGDVIKKVQIWREHLPQVQPFYAVKCNPDQVVLKLLKSLGVNFDCASKGEIKTILDMEVKADRIIFANPCKQISHIKYARANGIRLMTFDNKEELYKVKQYHPHAELIIRIRVDDSKSYNKLGMKFGADPENAGDLLDFAWNLGLDVVGVSFHVGSGCYDASVFYEATRSASSVFNRGSEVGYDFKTLNIGGGFPGHSSTDISFQDVVENLIRGFTEFFPPWRGIKIIAEPGRYFVSSAFTTICSVIAKREVNPLEMSSSTMTPSEDDEVLMYYYLNDGLYGSLNNIVQDHYVACPHVLRGKYKGAKLYNSVLWGPTCDSFDCISKSIKLPKLNVGDQLVFDNMGAYSTACASHFNGFEKPKTYYMCRKDLYHVKRTGSCTSRT